jgi:hypothetical protein
LDKEVAERRLRLAAQADEQHALALERANRLEGKAQGNV